MCPQVPTYINNILIGKRNLDHRGSFYVTCLTSGESFKCKIKEPLFGKGHHDVRPKQSAFCIPDAWVESRSLEMYHFAALSNRYLGMRHRRSCLSISESTPAGCLQSWDAQFKNKCTFDSARWYWKSGMVAKAAMHMRR